MKEITRIHLAKIAYDIELDAKKDIQTYIAALERYADDAELLSDIEIRITELLGERSVAAGGVITKDDVAAVRTQLGEPSDFAPEDSGATVVSEELEGPSKRMYRDVDSAIIGGVAAGSARFFGIDPLWMRLIFIIVLIASFGTAVVIYLLLWLVVPPARTAAEKLRMNGQSVTLASIKRLNEADEFASHAPATIRRILAYFVGVSATAGTVGALLATLFFGFGLPFGTTQNSPYAEFMPGSSATMTAAYVLFILSGVLLAALCSLVAYSAFTRRLGKRVGVAMVAVIAAGLMTFGLGSGLAFSHLQALARDAQAAMKEQRAALPEAFASIRRLSVSSQSESNYDGNGDAVRIDYIVSPGAPRYVLQAPFEAQPIVTIDGTTARIVFKTPQQKWAHHGVQVRLTMYGPALEGVATEQGYLQYTTAEKGQAKLQVRTRPATGITTYGSYEAMEVVGGGDADVSMSAVRALSVDIEGGASQVTAGVVQTLAVKQPDVCPVQWADEDQRTRVTVRDVSSGKLTYNGTVKPAATQQTPCGVVIVGGSTE